MAIYALADLHLSFSTEKPMDVFGANWQNHVLKVEKNWRERVKEDDLVIIPGDISWAMRLEEAQKDLQWIAALPGKKALIRGNHDYWWDSISRLRASLPEGVYALQNDHLGWDRWAVCGTRGWICPGEKWFDPETDQKIYQREVQRLKFSLDSALNSGYKSLIAALHYPPVNSKHEPSAFSDLLADYQVKFCVYGHLHAEGHAHALIGLREGVEYVFVAADGVHFCPQLLVP